MNATDALDTDLVADTEAWVFDADGPVVEPPLIWVHTIVRGKATRILGLPSRGSARRRDRSRS